MSGDERRTCNKDGDSVVGVWTGTEPVCEGELQKPLRFISTVCLIIKLIITVLNVLFLLTEIIAVCPDIQNPEHGQVSFDHLLSAPYIRGTKATYSCDLGYGLDAGDEVRTCKMDGFGPEGVWNGTEPYCIGNLSSLCLLLMMNLFLQHYLVDFLSVQITCSLQSQYVYIISVIDKQLFLTAVVVCPLLEVPENGTVTYSVDTETEEIGFGATATYSCNHESLGLSGGERVRVCVPDGDGDLIGQWSKKAPSCKSEYLCLCDKLETSSCHC